MAGAGRTPTQRLAALAGLVAIVGVVIGVFLLIGVVGGNDDVRAVELMDAPQPSGEEWDVGPTVGELAPDFEISDFDDDRYRLSDYRGKVVYINFWATWCVPCQKEMPDIDKLEEESDGEVVVISVNRREPVDRARDFLEGVPNLEGGEGVDFTVNGLDPDDTLYEHYRGLGMPTSVFVSPEGVVTHRADGIMTLDEMRAAADEAKAAQLLRP
jgi:thiol-disulfide isomerase/thioredoxin